MQKLTAVLLALTLPACTGLASERAERIPRGTELRIRTDQTIHSRSADVGRTYPATVARNVRDSRGRVVVPRGSDAELIVREVSNGGRFGKADLVLDLDSIRVAGRRYTVDTNEVEREAGSGIGRNRRTGEMIGGGALLGTLLGAIAGGGKGAAIGAIAGGAAGAGAEVMTSGKRVEVPAETVLTFRLTRSLHLEPRR
jgi:hypothetical protein